MSLLLSYVASLWWLKIVSGSNQQIQLDCPVITDLTFLDKQACSFISFLGRCTFNQFFKALQGCPEIASLKYRVKMLFLPDSHRDIGNLLFLYRNNSANCQVGKPYRVHSASLLSLFLPWVSFLWLENLILWVGAKSCHQDVSREEHWLGSNALHADNHFSKTPDLTMSPVFFT